jgi:hypothetical protein
MYDSMESIMKTNLPKLKSNVVNTLLQSAMEIARGDSIVNEKDITNLVCQLSNHSIVITQVQASRSIKGIKDALVRNLDYDEEEADYFIEEMNS